MLAVPGDGGARERENARRWLTRTEVTRRNTRIHFVRPRRQATGPTAARSPLSGVCARRSSEETHAAQHFDERRVGGTRKEVRHGEA